MTRSLYQFPYFELAYAPKHALPQHVFPSARRPKCRSYVESVCRMRSLAVKYLFMNFWSVGLFRSVTLRFYAWYWPCGWMFKCLAWPCPATFISCFSRHQPWHFGLLALRNTCCGNACFGAQVSSKYGTWYGERVILQFMWVGSLAGVTYFRYTVLTSSNKSETAVHCCDPALSVLVMLVSPNVFHAASALRSLAVSYSNLNYPARVL